ncbi:Protein PmbA [Candidatus Johnevansia muelleri]|uniref:Protein PmbA n=1 Tax=Candidatus Johnevansia muelleri TaxID=1495769 RepID=A0A078KBR1_9GAMM|nr:Protein PmbA [Candidatus Evansia muelleri]
MNKNELEYYVKYSLEYAMKKGVNDCEININIYKGINVNVYKGKIDNFKLSKNYEINISVYIDNCKINVLCKDINISSIKESIDKACIIAYLNKKKEYEDIGLADPSILAIKFPDLDIYHPWNINSDEAIYLSKYIENSVLKIKNIVNSEGVFMSTNKKLNIYANSNGFIGKKKSTYHFISCILIAGYGKNMYKGYDYINNCNMKYIQFPEIIGISAALKAKSQVGAIKPKYGKMPILFIPELARELISFFFKAISGNYLYMKQSFLNDCLGERIFPSWFSIIEKPLEIGCIDSASFDNEGVYTRNNIFIKNGILISYMLSNYSANRMGLLSTGNAGGARNVYIKAHLTYYASLIKNIDNGIMVTELFGQGVNIINGDYSRGAVGFLIKNGKIIRPLEEFTIASNLRKMFINILAVGDNIDYRNNIKIGSLLINEMVVSS